MIDGGEFSESRRSQLLAQVLDEVFWHAPPGIPARSREWLLWLRAGTLGDVEREMLRRKLARESR